MDSVSPTRETRDLASRLARRLEIEAVHHKSRRAHGRGDYLLRHDRIVSPILGGVLKLAGLYRRGVNNALSPVVRRWRFEFPDLPQGLDGFRILHLADLHIDGMDRLAEIVAELVEDIPVDLCVMSGDYRFEVDGSCDAIYPRMRRILSAVRARHGVSAILGNHDAAEIAFELENMGARVLVNEAIEVRHEDAGFWLIGLDDPHYYGCDDLSGALEAVPGGAFKVLLAHTPELYAEAAAAGVHLYLCGHTHAGQIRLPWLGAVLRNAACPKAYTDGPWSHASVQGYTSAGIGCSMLPVRYNCPPEIVVIELCRMTAR
jgi:predicted MPP superfamily phosphohydrolase